MHGRGSSAANPIASVCLLFVLGLPSTSAHIPLATNTLQLLTFQAELVVLAHIENPSTPVVLQEPRLHETVVQARVLETLKGQHDRPLVQFVQHGHGVLQYSEGAEVLLFLKPIEESRELANSPIAAEVDWVSQQETNAAYEFDSAARDEYIEAVKAYVAIQQLPLAERRQKLKRVTLELLKTSQEPLAISALRDLALAAEAYQLDEGDIAQLTELIDDARVHIGVRVGLLALLDQLGIEHTDTMWSELLRHTKGDELLAVVRAVRMHPSPSVNIELFRLLKTDDIILVAAAAMSLGALGNDAAIEPLVELLAASEPRVRMAAIRGLGGIGTPTAHAALEKASYEHTDAATRRRAGAEAAVSEQL